MSIRRTVAQRMTVEKIMLVICAAGVFTSIFERNLLHALPWLIAMLAVRRVIDLLRTYAQILEQAAALEASAEEIRARLNALRKMRL